MGRALRGVLASQQLWSACTLALSLSLCLCVCVDIEQPTTRSVCIYCILIDIGLLT